MSVDTERGRQESTVAKAQEAGEALPCDIEATLSTLLSGAGESALSRAYDIGCRAVIDGIGVLELVEVHYQVLAAILKRAGVEAEAVRIVKHAGRLFMESLAPFEATHRGYREADNVVRRFNYILEEEARRIAHTLHDESGQLLAATRIAIDRHIRQAPAEERESLEEIRRLLDTLAGELRGLSHELRPAILDDLGLVPAIELLTRGLEDRTGLHVCFTAALPRRVSPEAEIVLYRVIKEALGNVLKHAQANRASIDLRESEGRILCSIEDDGRGFEARSGHGSGIGLLGMRERVGNLGGTLEIESTPGAGTRLEIRLPLTTQKALHGNTSSSRR